ncbi:MAG: LamG-like jellyroll fold domain-containing protein [Planctomycetota bacterium]
MRREILLCGLIIFLICSLAAFAADEGLVSWWKFDQDKDEVTVDSASGINDRLFGKFKYVEGVSGQALKFDGFKTHVIRAASSGPKLSEAFTIEAWIAPQTYSWNWTGIVDQAGDEIVEKDGAGMGALKPGLIGARFGNAKFKQAEGINVLDSVDHDWTGGWNDWSGRWRGYIKGPFTGEVTFTAEADNGIKLEIDKKVVIDGWGRDKARTGVVTMEKGKLYPVVLSYFKDGDPAHLRVFWSWKGKQKKIIARSAFKYSTKDEAYVEEIELKREPPPKERDHRIFFGIDSEGHIGAKLMVNGELKECMSDIRLPLLKWAHAAVTFDKAKGVNLYVNGSNVGTLAVEGIITPVSGVDLLIGKGSKKMSPVNTERSASAGVMSNMMFDGLIDEVRIYNKALSSEEIGKRYRSIKVKEPQPLQYRVMPSGPKDIHARFGATYTRLNYAEEWERNWRVCAYPDILIRFDDSPVRMLFWRGTAYGAVWVTENGKWMGDQSIERVGRGKSRWGCAEHMSDKQCRYSSVRIIEENDARVVVHWRYAISDIAYEIFGTDKDGWGEWADEYYYIYPDAVSTRYQVLFSNHLSHEWQETIVLHQPGTKPEDNIEFDALTLANMDGQKHTYSWITKPERGNMQPDKPNIQMVNLKAKNKPFIIFEPDPKIKLVTCCIEKQWSHFSWWNHWPAGQLANDGRRSPAPDRPAHSSLSQAIEESEVISHDPKKGTYSAVTLIGMTCEPIVSLVPLARAWNHPAELKVTGGNFAYEGYDKSQRAYVLNCNNKGAAELLTFELAASEASPMVNPAFVVKNWGESGALLAINGKKIKKGKRCRFGYNHRMEGSDLVVWLMARTDKPIKVTIKPVK